MEKVKALFAAPAEVAFFYFAGHGHANELGGYLVAQDFGDDHDGLALTDILTLANGSEVRDVLILLDSCFSGKFGQIAAIDDRSALLREGVSVLTASRGSEKAEEGMLGGMFTNLVCAAFDGGAADVVGNVTMAGIYSYLDASLGQWYPRPLFKAHVSRLVSLRNCAPSIPREILRQLPTWFPQVDSELALDPSFEPTAMPRNAEREAVFAKLQKCRAVKLVEPVGTEHMYFAAIESKSCRLTALGRHYWDLVKKRRL
jgi:hypothetical protein